MANALDSALSLLWVDPNLSQAATYTYRGTNGSVPCRVIFYSPLVTYSPEGLPLATDQLHLDVRLSEVATANEGDTFTLENGLVYRVIGQPKKDHINQYWICELEFVGGSIAGAVTAGVGVSVASALYTARYPTHNDAVYLGTAGSLISRQALVSESAAVVFGSAHGTILKESAFENSGQMLGVIVCATVRGVGGSDEDGIANWLASSAAIREIFVVNSVEGVGQAQALSYKTQFADELSGFFGQVNVTGYKAPYTSPSVTQQQEIYNTFHKLIEFDGTADFMGMALVTSTIETSKFSNGLVVSSWATQSGSLKDSGPVGAASFGGVGHTTDLKTAGPASSAQLGGMAYSATAIVFGRSQKAYANFSAQATSYREAVSPNTASGYGNMAFLSSLREQEAANTGAVLGVASNVHVREQATSGTSVVAGVASNTWIRVPERASTAMSLSMAADARVYQGEWAYTDLSTEDSWLHTDNTGFVDGTGP